MKKAKKSKDHPEITDIKNICDIASTGKTEEVCKKVRQDLGKAKKPVSREKDKG